MFPKIPETPGLPNDSRGTVQVSRRRSRRRRADRDPTPEKFIARLPKHVHPYDLGEIAELLGSSFCKRLAEVWPLAFASDIPQYTEKRLSALLGFLKYVVTEAMKAPYGPQAALVVGLRDGEADPKSFANSTVAYCALLHDLGDRSLFKSGNKRTRNNTINALGATFKELARHKLLPVDHGMTAIPTGPFEPRTPTVAEVSAEGDLGPLDARAAFARLLRNPALAGHLGLNEGSADIMGAQDLGTAMVKVLQLRLGALRACAVADLEEEEEAWLEGEAFLSRADLPNPGHILSAIKQWQPTSGIETLLLELEGNGWPVLPGDAQSRLLAYIVRVMAGHYACEFMVRDLHPSLALAIAGCGGLREVTRRFEATMAAKTAAHLIVLIDTMFNVSVCDRLASDPFAGRSSRGRMEVATLEAIKRRARNKVVTGSMVEAVPEEVGKLDETCFVEVKRVDRTKSGVWAIQTWLKLSLSIRARAKRNGGDTHLYLWILSGGGKRYRGVARRAHFASDWQAWHEFLAKHANDPMIGGLPITREMIRVSCLQARSGPEDDSGRVMQPLAQHKSESTTRPYNDSKWMREVLSEQIRTFQNLLEASAASDIEDIARILGISPKLVLERRGLALQTGLGFFCAAPLAGVRPGTVKGEPCDKLDDCPLCRMRRFVPNPESLEALWLFHTALKSGRASWEATKPERWRVIYLTWLAVIMETEDKINSGRHKIKYVRAATATAKRLAAGEVSVPVLW